MDPRRGAFSSASFSEQSRIDEVRYLHSLWHQGPPRNPNPNPNNVNNNNYINLRPCNPPIFKKNKKNNNRRSRKRDNRNEEEEEEESSQLVEPVSEHEWPTEPIPEPRNEFAWPDSVPQPDLTSTRVLSEEEQEKFKGIQSQNKALKASQRFLTRNFGSDSEGEVDEDEDFMEDNDGDGEESEEFKFFFNLFTEDIELRNYYEKNWEGGDFPCFVCGVIGRKCGKRFKSCVSLVHHSNSISSTNQRKAHRAFGQVLCRVLGWEFNRLPTIVLSASGPLSRTLAQASSSQVANVESGNKVVDTVNADIAGGDQREELNGIAVTYVGDVNGNSADCENGIKKHDANDQQKEELNDIAVNSAVNGDGNSADCEAGTKANDANDQQKALDKEVVDTMGANSGEPTDFNVNSRKDGVAQQDQDFQKETVNSVGEVNEELVNKNGAGNQGEDFRKEMDSVEKGKE
ncbi:zinc finger protein [Macleaya cordata]|uniref:Zinc finger protein n=1 Tax=Macleaya cordata TaxID=56857 RepID=A0A200QJQ0_MACCD|nr:zinc finger protein [Macleaya cordata]